LISSSSSDTLFPIVVVVGNENNLLVRACRYAATDCDNISRYRLSVPDESHRALVLSSP
jgi:hypothetical protein